MFMALFCFGMSLLAMFAFHSRRSAVANLLLAIAMATELFVGGATSRLRRYSLSAVGFLLAGIAIALAIQGLRG